jgi:hypothetical protein
MTAIWEKVHQLEGRTLLTLYHRKPFEILKVTEKVVQLMPLEGKRLRRSILRNRIEHLAGLRFHRDELRKRVLQEYPTSRNTSYYAAIVHEISAG